MKILFLGKNIGMFDAFADAINEYTDHQASVAERLKTQKIFEKRSRLVTYHNPDGTIATETVVDDVQIDEIIIPSPIENPDIIINVGAGYFRFEDEAAMGMVKNVNRKKALYIMGAPPGRGGLFALHAPDWYFNDFWLTQCIDDKHHLKKSDGTPLWTDGNDCWLPLPLDISGIQGAAIPPVELKMSVALSGEALSYGGWDKGVETFDTAYRASGCKLDLIMDRPRIEALARKANSSVVFDSDKGNIGRSGLESMAQGVPVLAKLSPAVVACFEELGPNFPVITFTDQEDLNAKLIYFKTHLDELAAIGAASRAWMLAYYTLEMLVKYWCKKLEAKLA